MYFLQCHLAYIKLSMENIFALYMYLFIYDNHLRFLGLINPLKWHAENSFSAFLQPNLNYLCVI